MIDILAGVQDPRMCWLWNSVYPSQLFTCFLAVIWYRVRLIVDDKSTLSCAIGDRDEQFVYLI